jgi:peptidylprolyl isomerase
VGTAVVLAGAGWGGSVAWAGPRSAGARDHGKKGHSAAHRHHGPKLPVVKHAKDLNLEPVIRASKGKPPKKLEVRNLVKGTGATVTRSSTVDVIYVGANYRTGKDFTQATWTSKRPTAFPLSGVVHGFAEGLIGMRVGGRREIVIPPSLGYGDHNYGPIKAGETLVFVVDLKGVSG